MIKCSVPRGPGRSFGHSLNCSANHFPRIANPSRRIAEACHPARVHRRGDLRGSVGNISGPCSVQF
jgi:hypothetical protein